MYLHNKNKIVIARSNKEADYQALVDTTFFFGFVGYLKIWVSFILLQLSSIVIIKVLSRLLKIMNSIKSTKYIKIDCYFVQHHLTPNTIRLFSVLSINQTINIFTKACPHECL